MPLGGVRLVFKRQKARFPCAAWRCALGVQKARFPRAAWRCALGVQKAKGKVSVCRLEVCV